MKRFAVEITVDICDLVEDEHEIILEAVRDAVAEWKPVISSDVREYGE